MRRDDRTSGLRFERQSTEQTGGATSRQVGKKSAAAKFQPGNVPEIDPKLMEAPDIPAASPIPPAAPIPPAGKHRQPDLRPADPIPEAGPSPPPPDIPPAAPIPDAPPIPEAGPMPPPPPKHWRGAVKHEAPDASRQVGTKSGKLHFEDEAPEGGPNASGQAGPKSKRAEGFKQESQKARPSDRMHHEDAPPGGDSGRGKAGAKSKKSKVERKIDKSKLRMERSDAKLGKAQDKLAKQKPVKRPGPIRTLGREARGRAWAYGHKKISEVEHENVGTEGAHKSELVAEGGIRKGASFAKKRIRTRPARKVRKLRRKNVKATADYHFRKLAQEHPHLTSNPLSRMWQKRKLKKKYAKQAREAAKQGAKAAKKTAVTTEKIATRILRAAFLFVKRHPIVTLVIVLLLVLMMVISSIVSTLGMVGSGIAGAAGGTSFLAEDGEIDGAELAYTEWETDLYMRAMNADNSHPGYDEYRYNVADISHNPYELMAYLTATFDDFTFAGVEAHLRELFNEQYTLTFNRIVERRSYREDGETIYYNYYIMEVTLTARSFTSIIYPRMDDEQMERYQVYMITKGNRQYLHSPFGDLNWLPYVSSYYGWRVHPTTGEKNLHRGADIALPQGTEILAGQDGTVTFAGESGDYGLVVVLDDGEGLVSKYAHCSVLLVGAGQIVQVGDPIAQVGSTGRSTGPHLHLEIIKDGQYLNPLYFAVTNDFGQGPDYGGDPGTPMGDGSYAALIAEAERHLGKPYVFGASGPNSFDCSGYVCYVLNQSGVADVGRVGAQSLYNLCTPISASEAQPGDLIFFTGTYSTASPVSHVGIYVGGGRMIHCGDPISYTSVNTSYWQSHFYAYGRLN